MSSLTLARITRTERDDGADEIGSDGGAAAKGEQGGNIGPGLVVAS